MIKIYNIMRIEVADDFVTLASIAVTIDLCVRIRPQRRQIEARPMHRLWSLRVL